MTLFVSEIFPAIQGEGKELGMPTVFLRLSGCNLSCSFCDTPYHTEGKEMSLEEVFQEIEKYKIKHVTVSGGEPTLQDREVHKLIMEFLEVKYDVSLESNGVIATHAGYSNITISPKKQKINIKVLKEYAKYPNVTFKFVYESNDDEWWLNVINDANINLEKVYIMPEGATRTEQIDKMPEVIKYCLEKGFKFSPRLHVLVFDDERGK